MRVEGYGHVWALGDAAMIPLQENPTEPHHWAPPTAQFAVREARVLAQNLQNAVTGKDLGTFVYKSKGAMASLSARRGVAEVYGMRISGLPAWMLWRVYDLSFVPGIATKVRIAANWFLDAILGRNIVQTGTQQSQATQYVRYSAGDRIFETGNRADGFYMVMEGAVELRIPAGPDSPEMARRIEARGHFGERVILGGGLRTGRAVAVEDAKVLVCNAEDFRRIAEALPVLNEYFNSYILNTYGGISKR